MAQILLLEYATRTCKGIGRERSLGRVFHGIRQEQSFSVLLDIERQGETIRHNDQIVLLAWGRASRTPGPIKGSTSGPCTTPHPHMPHSSKGLVPFQEQLTRYKIPYIRHTTGAIEVQGDVWISDTRVEDLPEDLTVHGVLSIVRCGLDRLPRRLVALRGLFLNHTQVAELPKSMSIGGDVSLRATRITALPAGLQVQGRLDVRETALERLPEGLAVGGWLDFRQTPVTRLPEDMTVGGEILPPSCLHDLQAFMHDRPETILRRSGSAHAMMDLRETLAPYPDLWRIFLSMGPNKQLHLCRSRFGVLYTRVHPAAR